MNVLQLLPKSVMAFCILAVVSSCTSFNNPMDDDFEVAKTLETKTQTIGMAGGIVKLSDNTSIEIPADAIGESFTLTLSNISPEKLFSTSNSLVYDIDFSTTPQYFIINFQLKQALNKEDISIVCYDPDNTDEMISGYGPDFEYDANTGIATSVFYPGVTTKSTGNLKSINHELLFKRWVAEWDENVEGSTETNLLEMPYYTQAGGSCVTTCATMLTKAYKPYRDRESETEIYHFLKYLGISKNDGVGPYTFLHSLIKAFHLYTGAGVISEGYFNSSSLQSKIIKEIDNGHPIILNMNYPKIGRHAILIVGYEKVTTGSQKVSYNIIYHNPNLSSNMYSKNSFEWLMSDKSMVVAYQIIFSSNEAHPKRALQTVGLPLNEDGHIKCNANYTITLDYNLSGNKGYGWFNPAGTKVDTIPAGISSLDLLLPVWNADLSNEKDVKMNVQISQEGINKAVYSEDFPIHLPVGKDAHWFKKSIPASSFISDKGGDKYTLYVRLYDQSDTYLDGFLVDVFIEPTSDDLTKLKKCKHIDFDFSFDYYTTEPEYVHSSAMQFIREHGDIQWKGTSFRISHSSPGSFSSTGDKFDYFETISGTVSGDAK